MDEKKNITTKTPPEEIEADIARTRREISGTVGAIRERVSAEHFTGEAKDTIRESPFVVKMKTAASRIGEQAKGTGNQILDTVKRDPVPLAMVGIGIAWLIYSRTQHDGTGRAIAESREAISSKAGELSGKMQAKAGEFSERVQAKAGEYSRQAREKSSLFAQRAKQTAGNITMTARERAVFAKNRFQEIVNDNPFAATAAALAIGSAIGFIVPATGKEKEVLGTASDRLLARAKETAQETIQKAEHAAERAIQTAKEEFK